MVRKIIFSSIRGRLKLKIYSDQNLILIRYGRDYITNNFIRTNQCIVSNKN